MFRSVQDRKTIHICSLCCHVERVTLRKIVNPMSVHNRTHTHTITKIHLLFLSETETNLPERLAVERAPLAEKRTIGVGFVVIRTNENAHTQSPMGIAQCLGDIHARDLFVNDAITVAGITSSSGTTWLLHLYRIYELECVATHFRLRNVIPRLRSFMGSLVSQCPGLLVSRRQKATESGEVLRNEIRGSLPKIIVILDRRSVIRILLQPLPSGRGVIAGDKLTAGAAVAKPIGSVVIGVTVSMLTSTIVFRLHQ